MFGFGKQDIDPGLFWSSYYKMDANALVKAIGTDAKKALRSLETEIRKLDNVGYAINEGRNVIKNTVCSKCKEELIKKTKQHQTKSNEEPKTRKEPRIIPPERRSLIDDMISLVMQNEKLKNGTAVDDEYMTLEDYCEQKILEMKEKHEIELQSINNNISHMENEIKQLTVQLKDKTKEVETLEKTNNDQQKKYEAEAKIKVDALRMSVESKENAYMKLKETLSTSEGYIKDLQRQVKDLQQELHQVKGLQQEFHNVHKENDRLNILVDTLSKEQQKQRNNSGRNDELRNLQKERDNMEIKMKTSQQENERIQMHLREQVEKLENEKKNMSSKYEELQGNYTAIKRDLSAKDEELQTVQLELRNIQRAKKRLVVMGIRSERSGMGKTMVDIVTKELEGRLQGLLESSNINLSVKACQTSADVPNGPLVVLCLNISRVGANIQSALEGVRYNSDMFVVVLHNTSKENLSSLTPTSLRISRNEFGQLGGILDFAFGDGGLYDCELNNKATEKMASILKKY